MKFIDQIEALKEKRIKTYQDDIDVFLSIYRGSINITKEYNGRQLLEMLQNADDAKATCVKIELDTQRHKLRIFNNGEPFSVGGIESLMLIHASTKHTGEFIGNKGLGFRSLLNWSSKINILTNGCKISFSEAIARHVYENHIVKSQQKRDELCRSRDYDSGTLLFPILGIPRVEAHDTEGGTTVEVYYDPGFLESIECQLQEIYPEILLFLNNLESIDVEIDGAKIKHFKRSKSSGSDFDSITIGGYKWNVFTREGELPLQYRDPNKKTPEKYQVKIALSDNLPSQSYSLYNFFPTKLEVKLPCIIHATVELESSRNHLIESEKNKFVFEEIFSLLQVCHSYLKSKDVNWEPYKLINHGEKFDRGVWAQGMHQKSLLDGLYENLNEYKENATTYPTIGKGYVSSQDYALYTPEFSQYWLERSPLSFPELLLPQGNLDILPRDYKEDIFRSRMNQFANEIKLDDFNARVELIELLARVTEKHADSLRLGINLLVNNHPTTPEIITNKTCFTPDGNQMSGRIVVPSYVQIDFVNDSLYKQLVDAFKPQFSDDPKTTNARELQRLVRRVVNIQAYDSANIRKQITARTKSYLTELKDNEEQQKHVVREFVKIMHHNYKIVGSQLDKLEDEITLISQSGDLTPARNLFLGNTYSSGKLTQAIYDGVYDDTNYLAGLSEWGISVDEDPLLIDQFFTWLGVNQYYVAKEEYAADYWSNSLVNQFLETGAKKAYYIKESIFKESGVKDNKFHSIGNMSDVKRLNVSQILLLVMTCEKIRNELFHMPEIKFKYNGDRYTRSSHSYLRHQFIQTGLFTSFIVEELSEDLLEIVNQGNKIDYQLLSSDEFPKMDIYPILKKLGAKDGFDSLLPSEIYNLLNRIALNPMAQSGRGMAKINKLALESLIKNNQTTHKPVDLKLFAKRNGKGEFVDCDQIYYSDNKTLPVHISKDLWILDLPKRTGERNVAKYLGVKTFDELELEICPDAIVTSNLQCQFDDLFHQLKPLLLTYRLFSPTLKRAIQDQDLKKQAAAAIKSCKVILVKQCDYRFQGQDYHLEPYSYLSNDEEYYLHIGDCHTIEELQKNSKIRDSFAEIICMRFKINECKSEFRHIFRNEIIDTKHEILIDFQEDDCREISSLMGVNQLALDFWTKVCLSLNLKPVGPTNSEKEFYEQIEKITLSDFTAEDYLAINYQNFDNQKSFDMLCNLVEKGCSIEELTPNGLQAWHKSKFMQLHQDYDSLFTINLWAMLEHDKSQQKLYVSKLEEYKYLNLDILASEVKCELRPDYELFFKKNIKEYYGVALQDQHAKSNERVNLYQDVLDEFDVEERDITDKEVRSVLYFEGNADLIRNYLGTITNSDKPISHKTEPDEVGSCDIVWAQARKAKQKNTSGAKPKSTRSVSYNKKIDQRKSALGKKAETEVIKSLREKFGMHNVKWVSSYSDQPIKDDNLGYDAEYCVDGVWRMLEIKYSTDGKFILTQNEKTVGMSQINPYDLALFDGSKIFLIQDVFKFNEDETFDTNEKFSVAVKDYYLAMNCEE